MESKSAAGRGRGRGGGGGNRSSGGGGATGGGGGGSSNRRRMARSGGGGASKKRGIPPPPQLKLALRHIGNPMAYGTTKAVLEDLLLPLIEAFNSRASHTTAPSVPLPLTQKTTVATTTAATTTTTAPIAITSALFLEIDHTAKRHLIDEEEAAQKFLRDWRNKQAAEDVEGLRGEDADVDLNMSDAVIVESESPGLEVVTAPPPKPPPGAAVISVRPLCVIPPKRSRRRGDRPGVAYILLTAPKFDKVEIPQTVPENAVPKVVAKANSGPKSKTTPSADATDDQSKSSKQKQDEASGGQTVGAKETGKNPSVSSAKKPADYSRQVAHGRLLLQTATELLKEVTALSANTTASRASWVDSGRDMSTMELTNPLSITIEPATCGKTWRWQNSRSDRRENTLESTSDYQHWLSGLEKHVADIKARPKPAPGGGVVTVDEHGNTSTASQPIATLVQHLLVKQQEMKRTKVKKTKETPASTSTTVKEGKGKEGKAKSAKGRPKNPKKGKATTAKSEGTPKASKNKQSKKKANTSGGGNANPKATPST